MNAGPPPLPAAHDLRKTGTGPKAVACIARLRVRCFVVVTPLGSSSFFVVAATKLPPPTTSTSSAARVDRLILDLLGTAEKTRPPGRDETGLLTLCCLPGDGGCFTNMLMVTTTVRMVDGVHGNTTSLGPAVALGGELMLGSRGLEERLVCSATSCDDTNHTTGRAGEDLLGTGGELDTGLALVGVVANDGHVVSGGTAERTAVTRLVLDVGEDGTLGDGGEGEDVADGQVGVLSGVDELASVHALVGDEGLDVVLESVWVAEDDLSKGSATTGVVNDLLYDTSNVAIALGVVEGSELGGGLVQTGVGREDRAATFTLVPNNPTHCDGGV